MKAGGRVRQQPASGSKVMEDASSGERDEEDVLIRASSAGVLPSSDSEDGALDHDARLPDSGREEHRAGLRKRQTARAKVKASAVVKRKMHVRKMIYCGSCKGCRILTDCAKCTMCRDKPEVGGPGVKKQKCELRRCVHHPRLGSRLANRPDQVLDLPIKDLRTSEPQDLRTSGDRLRRE